MTNLAMPPSVNDGIRVATLNKFGWMVNRVIEPADEFIELASKSSNWALDIGCAYGINTIEAIKAGARVIANDIDLGHLEILRQQLSPELGDRLKTIHGPFLDIDVEPSSLGAVLACRVLHFFDPTALERTAEKIFSLLAPGGKVFIRTMTPYTAITKDFVPEYDRRKTAGDRWPGFVEDATQYLTDEQELSVVGHQPFHYLDPEILYRTFADAGFSIDRCQFVPVLLDFLRFDGREAAVVVATKS